MLDQTRNEEGATYGAGLSSPVEPMLGECAERLAIRIDDSTSGDVR